ncbi:MAG: hypothetical protein ACLTZ2_09905 [Desulfovibrio sp.]|jgi:hypothetical protein
MADFLSAMTGTPAESPVIDSYPLSDAVKPGPGEISGSWKSRCNNLQN